VSELLGVQADQIEAVWPYVESEIERGVQRSHDTLTVETVRDGLENRDMQLWVSLNDKDLEAVCVTQIVDYPGMRVCALLLIAGKNRRAWWKFGDVISAWASERGCEMLEGHARRGWMPEAEKDGWSEAWITVRKPIDVENIDGQPAQTASA
jgi:hypothetical protein